MGFEKSNIDESKTLSAGLGVDLFSEDYVTKILVSGTAKQFEELKQDIERNLGKSLSQAEMDLFRDLARQRHTLIKQSNKETKERIVKNPKATPEEYSMGVYYERLEPQVRDAVFVMHKKGYASYESGFIGYQTQRITLFNFSESLKSFSFSSEFTNWCQSFGVELFVKPNAVGYKLERLLTDDQLKQIWDRLVEELPQLDQAQKPGKLGNAELFREKQEKMA